MYNIIPISAFNDNYIWCMHDGTQAIIVDPGDAVSVIDYLQQQHLVLAAILITHHHSDHIGGVDKLKQIYPQVQTYSTLKIIATHIITVNSVIVLKIFSQPLKWQILPIPGHTLDHIAFYNDEFATLFCGDTLFSCGCGRIFEGTYSQMYQSLNSLAALPDNTQIFPAHEYTLNNIRFALTLEPDNQDLQKRYTQCLELRKNNQPTLPVSLAREKLTNPFLRCKNSDFVQAINRQNDHPLAVFTYIRQLKDKF